MLSSKNLVNSTVSSHNYLVRHNQESKERINTLKKKHPNVKKLLFFYDGHKGVGLKIFEVKESTESSILGRGELIINIIYSRKRKKIHLLEIQFSSRLNINFKVIDQTKVCMVSLTNLLFLSLLTVSMVHTTVKVLFHTS